jgi:hypothetical protein
MCSVWIKESDNLNFVGYVPGRHPSIVIMECRIAHYASPLSYSATCAILLRRNISSSFSIWPEQRTRLRAVCRVLSCGTEPVTNAAHSPVPRYLSCDAPSYFFSTDHVPESEDFWSVKVEGVGLPDCPTGRQAWSE